VILFHPSDSLTSFATPQALSANPGSYDLESISPTNWPHARIQSFRRLDAMMFPFAPAPGTFAGQRPTTQQPDARWRTDDRTGLPSLYHDPNDTLYVGSIQGHIIPANPIRCHRRRRESPEYSPHTSWPLMRRAARSSQAPWAAGAARRPPGANSTATYEIDQLPVGQSYKIYAEPLDGAVAPSDVSNALVSSAANSHGSRLAAAAGCVVPPANTTFNHAHAFLRLRPTRRICYTT